ncbi:hypothetical protein T4D_3796 [Trichinella pseudospiralis]|uniref:Uncharacterized protein n=1 Tax=Trichinella pseudospiralis TaxID=6337 RepID=A0A0V1G1C4_TRIPS|nr:hypothetical protein T4D_3796 [Trichinella pseudospiralis]
MPQAEIETIPVVTLVWHFNSAVDAFPNQLIVILLKILKNKFNTINALNLNETRKTIALEKKRKKTLESER